MKLVSRQKFIATAIILGIATTPFTSSLFSSTSTAFAAEAGTPSVTEVRTLGLMTGDAKGDFMPEKVLTRAEMAKILCNIFQLDVQPASNTLYLDVSAANWSAPYIEAVQKAGYMDGTGELFHPNQAVTRQELITSLVKAMDLHSDNNGATLSSMDVARSYGLAIADNATDANAPLNRQTSADLFIQLLDHPVGQVDAQGNTVRVGNIPYKVNGDLQGLFGVENGTVLKGAKLDIDRSQRTVTHVNTIELNSNGGVFDGKGLTFNGNLIVNGSVTLKNIQSTGNLQVNGNGDATLNTQLDNSSWANVTISSPTSTIQASGDSKIGKLTVNNTATVKTNNSASIQQLVIQPNLKQLTLDGQVDELDASQYDGNPLVTLQPSAGIGNIKLSKNKTATDIIRNYTEQKSNVTNINGAQNTDNNSSNSSSAGNNISTKKKDKDKDKTPAIIELDVSRLLDGIDQANDLLTHPKDMPELEEVPTLWSDMLQQAIVDAKATLNQENHTQQDINAAAKAIAKANQRYAASQNALYSYYDLFTTIRKIPINYTDAGRFDFKERLIGFGLDYYNPSTTKEQFDEYTQAIAEMRMQFEQIKDIDFTELNLKLIQIDDLSRITKNAQDAAKLNEMYERYTNAMHRAMTQEQVNVVLQQATEELIASGLDRPQHSETDYREKLMQLSSQVVQLIYGNNDQLERYMEGEFGEISQVLNKANLSMMEQDAPWTLEEAYTNLDAAFTTFKLSYDVKLGELRNALNEQIIEIDRVMIKYGEYMPQYDAQRLTFERQEAEQLLNSDSSSVSKLGYMQYSIANTLKNANLKDPTALLIVINQAKMEYEAYSGYHDDYYGGDSYKDNMKFYSVLSYAQLLIPSENARQSNLDEYEQILKAALEEYSKDWITSSMIENILNSAQYQLDHADSPFTRYYQNLDEAKQRLQSRSSDVSFVELRDMYISLIEAEREFVMAQNQSEQIEGTPVQGGNVENPSSTPDSTQQPSSSNEETPDTNTAPASGTEETAPASETPGTQEPVADPSPDSSDEQTSQPVNNDPQPTVVEPENQNYDYSRPPQQSEEAEAATPVIANEPETTDTP